MKYMEQTKEDKSNWRGPENPGDCFWVILELYSQSFISEKEAEHQVMFNFRFSQYF